MRSKGFWALTFSWRTEKKGKIPETEPRQKCNHRAGDVGDVGEDEDGVEGTEAEEDQLKEDDLAVGVRPQAGVGGVEDHQLGQEDEQRT